MSCIPDSQESDIDGVDYDDQSSSSSDDDGNVEDSDDDDDNVEENSDDGDDVEEEDEEEIEEYLQKMEKHVKRLDGLDYLDDDVLQEMYGGGEMGDDDDNDDDDDDSDDSEDKHTYYKDFFVEDEESGNQETTETKKKKKSVSFALPEPDYDEEEEHLRKLLDDVYEREHGPEDYDDEEEDDEEEEQMDEEGDEDEDDESDESDDEDDGGLFLPDGRLNPDLNLAKINAAGQKRSDKESNRLIMMDDDDDDDNFDDDDDGGEDDINDVSSLPKTAFELHQEQVLEQMEHLEDQNVMEKKWQESGEAFKWQRPQNSLLEEDLAFQHAFKSKPIITEEMTRDLESIIVHRIVSGVFDDPVRPDLEEPEQLRKDVELKHEKSKKSLAQIYEEEYMRRVEGVEPEDAEEENEEVKRVKEKLLFKVASVLRTLNMMSSFNYIAPPVEPPKTGTRNKATPAISMEEKMPIAVSEETLQAPEEIMKPVQSLPTGDNERTSQERQSKRRRAKDKASRKAKKAKQLVEQLNPGQADERHKEKLVQDLIKKQERMQASRSEDSTKYTNSKAFFNILQENLQKYGTNTKAPKKQFQDVEEAERRRKMIAKKI